MTQFYQISQFKGCYNPAITFSQMNEINITNPTSPSTLDDPWYIRATNDYYAMLSDRVFPTLAETNMSNKAFKISQEKIRYSMGAKETSFWYEVVYGILDLEREDTVERFDDLSDEDKFVMEEVIEAQMRIFVGLIEEIARPMGIKDVGSISIRVIKEHFCSLLLDKSEDFIEEQYEITCDRLKFIYQETIEIGKLLVLDKKLSIEKIRKILPDQLHAKKMLIACLVALLPDIYENEQGEVIESNLHYVSSKAIKSILDHEARLAGITFVRGVIDSAIAKVPAMVGSKAILERPFTARRLLAFRYLSKNGFVNSDLSDIQRILAHPDVEAQLEKLEKSRRSNDLYWGLEFEKVVDYNVEKLPPADIDSDDPYEVLRAVKQSRKIGQQISLVKFINAIKAINLKINPILKEIIEDRLEEGNDIINPEDLGILIDIVYFNALDNAFMKYSDEQEKGNDVGPLEIKLAYKFIRSVETGYNRWRYQHFAHGQLAELGIPVDQDILGEVSLPFSQAYHTQIIASEILAEMGIIDPEQKVTIHFNISNFTYVDLEATQIDLLMATAMLQASSYFGTIAPGNHSTRIGFPHHSKKSLYNDINTPPHGLPIRLYKPEQISEIPDPDFDDEGKFLQRLEYRGLTLGEFTFEQALQMLKKDLPILDGILKHIGKFSEYYQDNSTQSTKDEAILQWVALIHNVNEKFSRIMLANSDEEELAEIEERRKDVIDNVNKLLHQEEPMKSLHLFWDMESEKVEPIEQSFFSRYLIAMCYYATFTRNKKKRDTTFDHPDQVLDGLNLLRTALGDRSFWDFIFTHQYEEVLQVQGYETLKEYLIRFRKITDQYYGRIEYWESYIGILVHYYNTHKEEQIKLDNALKKLKFVKENLD